MKSGFIKFSIIGLISLNLFSAAFIAAQKTKKPIEPTVKEAVKQIFLNGDILLSSVESCKSVGTSSSDKTILDFLSGVLSFQAEPNSQNRIEFTFKKEKSSRNEIVWICDLMFYGKDEESVWGNGVRFKLRNSDRKLIRSSVMCIGTG